MTLLSFCIFPFAFFLSPQALEVPFLAGRVNDTAHMLSSSTIEGLEAMLKTHEDSTSNQVVVLTIPGLQGEVLEDYSMRVVETWKIGQAKHDNGVLLLVARDDRKMRIEVGSGLEGDLPDVVCGRIIRHEITPRFRDGDFDAGVRAGVQAILAAIRGAYLPQDHTQPSRVDWGNRLLALSMFLIVVGTFTWMSILSTGSAGWFIYFFLFPFWLAFLATPHPGKIGLVLFLTYIFGVGIFKLWLAMSAAGKELMEKWRRSRATRTAKGRARHDTSGPVWGDSGSSWSSSSSDSFSGGGGSFSGGGASGSW